MTAEKGVFKPSKNCTSDPTLYLLVFRPKNCGFSRQHKSQTSIKGGKN